MLDAVLSLLPSPHREDSVYRSGCPFCGGGHRFAVSTEHKPAGRYHCFGCGRSGDLVTLARELKGLGFKEACAWLGLSPNYVMTTPTQSWSGLETSSVGGRVSQGERVPSSSTERTEPRAQPPEWTKEAAAFLKRCLHEHTPDMALHLYRRRFLDARSESMDIGWHEKFEAVSRKAWGLPPKNGDDRLWLGRGIVFAWRRNGKVIGMKIRTPNEDLEAYRKKYGKDLPKIRSVEGSRIAPVIYHDAEKLGAPCALMESALDAALIYQQSDGQVSAIGLNGASQRIDEEADRIIRAARPLLIIPDIDETGISAGRRLEKAYSPNAVLCAVPYGKDPCESQSRAFACDTFYGLSEYYRKRHIEFPTIRHWIFEQALPFALEEMRKNTQA